MRILSKPSSEWRCDVTCNACSAKLEVDQDDIAKEDSQDPRDMGPVYFVSCAVCSGRIYVDARSVPPIVKLHLANPHKRLLEKTS
jgi:hypothetical protein